MAENLIHPKAVVEADCEFGPGAIAWAFAQVIRESHVGFESNIGSMALVDCAHVGERCIIGHAAQLHPGTWIGNDVFVGPGVIFCNDRWPRANKHGWDRNKLLVAHQLCIIVYDRASIGAGAVILPGVTIGAGAMIAAGARVAESVPPMHLFKANGQCVEIDRRQTNRLPLVTLNDVACN